MPLDVLDRVISLCRDAEAGRRSMAMETRGEFTSARTRGEGGGLGRSAWKTSAGAEQWGGFSRMKGSAKGKSLTVFSRKALQAVMLMVPEGGFREGETSRRLLNSFTWQMMILG